jgi:hypothetical protein
MSNDFPSFRGKNLYSLREATHAITIHPTVVLDKIQELLESSNKTA